MVPDQRGKVAGEVESFVIFPSMETPKAPAVVSG